MELDLTDRTVVVTGASRGIGLAIARRFASEGARVLGVARTITPELASVAHTTLAVDLTAPDSGDRIAAAARELAQEGIDVLVNNAGGLPEGGEDPGHLAGFASISDDAWRRTIDLNLLAAVRVTRALVDQLLAARGVVVNLSSIGARVAGPGLDYGVAKAGVTALTKALSEEYAPQGMRAVTVSPGPTRTSMWTRTDGPSADLARAMGISLEDLVAGVPAQARMSIGRLVEPDEIASTVAFLASPAAAAITGIDVLVDGGAVKTV